MITKHDDLFARAWECDYETPILNIDDHNTAPPDPTDFAVRSDLPPEEMWNPPGASRECGPEFFPSADGLYNGTDTYQFTEHDAEMSLEQHRPLFTDRPVKIPFTSQTEA